MRIVTPGTAGSVGGEMKSVVEAGVGLEAGKVESGKESGETAMVISTGSRS